MCMSCLRMLEPQSLHRSFLVQVLSLWWSQQLDSRSCVLADDWPSRTEEGYPVGYFVRDVVGDCYYQSDQSARVHLLLGVGPVELQGLDTDLQFEFLRYLLF